MRIISQLYTSNCSFSRMSPLIISVTTCTFRMFAYTHIHGYVAHVAQRCVHGLQVGYIFIPNCQPRTYTTCNTFHTSLPVLQLHNIACFSYQFWFNFGSILVQFLKIERSILVQFWFNFCSICPRLQVSNILHCCPQNTNDCSIITNICTVFLIA